MPLDTGAVADIDIMSGARGGVAPVRPARVTLDTAGNVGEALRAARLARGRSLEEIAEVTRVRPAHIEAIENFDLSKLPSRPFTVGYVRAYAAALGADSDAAVVRFRSEAPDEDTALHTPIGVRHQKQRRFGSIAFVAVAAALAVLVWNVARHAMSTAPKPAVAVRHVAAIGRSRTPAGPVSLGAPLPAPPEATIPAPYETPGMAAATAAGGSADAALAASRQAKAAAANVPVVQATLGEPFVPAGAIYGDGADAAGVILQAKKPTSLTVHRSDGSIYFTRWLAAGEAWRAPADKGLSVDASSPEAVEVYAGGVSRGLLAAPTTPLSKFGA